MIVLYFLFPTQDPGPLCFCFTCIRTCALSLMLIVHKNLSLPPSLRLTPTLPLFTLTLLLLILHCV